VRATPNPLTVLYSDIRASIEAAARACAWADFEREIARHLTRTRLPPHVVLPLASARAVGGAPRRALSVAVACAFLIASMRWFDDAQDRDRGESLCNELGTGRAVNMAAAALTVAWNVLANDDALPPAVLHSFGRHTVVLAHGQDRDLQGGVPETLDDYWNLMRGKSGAALSLACEAGALAANPQDPSGAVICGRFGAHMGLAMQILDDLDGAFRPDGIGDIRAGKATLPVLYGLAVDHPGWAELHGIVSRGHLSARASRVCEILDAIDTREFLVWSAFEERKQALACVDELSARASGRGQVDCQGLRDFADLIVVEWESLLSRDSDAYAREHA
jgi:geranylgeranyl pyrophosphate synthase